MEEKKIFISLEDKRLKDVAESITNKTCNKILQYLIEKTATVSDISEDLKLPINTIDYNIKKLLRAGLIESNSHWWSVKGKKMPAYKISNKEIIIKPKELIDYKKYLVAALSTGVLGLIINKLSQKMNSITLSTKVPTTDSSIAMLTETSCLLTEETTAQAIITTSQLGIGSWFILGAWFIILLFFVYSIVTERRNKK